MAKKKDTAEVEATAEAPATAEETVVANAAEETAEVEYTVEEVQSQLKPLSENAFVRFWQKIWRWWLGVWYGFSDKHPKLSPWIYKLGFFFAFSMAVTVWQFLIMLFLPEAFKSVTQSFAWPGVQVGSKTWLQPDLVEPVKNAAGKVMGYTYAKAEACFSIFGDDAGLGNWLAFEIATFTAQCINFPLQRNITYKSHGNPWYQAMWYFIGWVAISFFTGAVWGIIDPFLKSWGWYYVEKEVLVDGVAMKLLVVNGGLNFLATIFKTFITGGVSMIIFFFIFMVIFPDNNKMAKKARAKYEKLVAANAPAEKVAKAEAKMNLWETKAAKSNAESEYGKAVSQVNASIMKYNTFVKASEKAAEEAQKAEEAAQAQNTEKATAKAAEAKQKAEVYPEKIANAFNAAVAAIKVRDEKKVANEAAQAL